MFYFNIKNTYFDIFSIINLNLQILVVRLPIGNSVMFNRWYTGR